MSTIIAIISGLLMSVQGVWNTRITEKAGIWVSNTVVHGVGLITCLCIVFFASSSNFPALRNVNKFYLLSGALGAGIVYSVIVAITKLGPAQATMLILVAQLVGSYLIELLGLFGTEKAHFQWMKLLGLGIIISGIILFQWKK